MNAYRAAADVLIRESGVTVRKWRKGSNGTAYTKSDDWGIESPEPNGSVSFAVFAHEVGHQCLHRRNSTPRWQEEIEADEFALAQFERFDLAGIEQARAFAARCLAYSFSKAIRRSPRLAGVIASEYPEWMALALAHDRYGRLARVMPSETSR
jgi:hypothetical protein